MGQLYRECLRPPAWLVQPNNFTGQGRGVEKWTVFTDGWGGRCDVRAGSCFARAWAVFRCYSTLDFQLVVLGVLARPRFCGRVVSDTLQHPTRSLSV